MAEMKDHKANSDLSGLFSQDQEPARPGRTCSQCGFAASSDSQVLFCGRCGAALAPPSPKRVLIVDDSTLSRKTLGAILLQLGCQVLEAADGLQALKLARAESPRLIVLDVVMPGMSGLDFLNLLAEDEPVPKPKVIMLTSKADLSTVSQALSKGAVDYLLKHSPPEEIKARLQKHLAS